MLYKNILLQSIKNMMNLKDDLSAIEHHPTEGRLREIFLEELLKPYMSNYMQTCTGKIISSNGNISDQIDIIIYDSEIIPPAFLKQYIGVIPIESVIATIEVKKELNADGLKDSILNAISVKKLNYAPEVSKNGVLHHVPSFVFAFNSDLKEKIKTEKDRIIENINLIKKSGENYDAPIGGVCIPGKTYIYFEDKKKKGKNSIEDKWHVIDWDNDNYYETMMFITSLLDNCFQIKNERLRISIGHYIFNDYRRKLY